MNRARATAGTLALFLICGCMGGGEVAPPGSGGSGPSGKVIQGPVDGATIFADRIVSGGLGDMTRDSSEAPYETVTDSSGHFTLPAVPPYPYVIVSRGGTDTLSGKTAGMMLAPAGAQNVSALTTMVAINPALQAKIESLMGGAGYDSDISLSVTPAALMLAKTIETSVQALTESLNPLNPLTGSATLSTSQVNDIQLTSLTNLAAQVSALSALQLSTPADLKTMVTAAVTATATTIDTRYLNIDIGSAATLASTIAETVPAIATAISGSATAPLVSTGATAEASQLPPSDQNLISAAVSSSVSTNEATVSVAPPLTTPDMTDPIVSATTPANAATNVAPNSSITAEFSEPLELSTVIPANFSVSGVTGGAVSWNNASNSVTFSGALPVSSTVTVTISGMKDLSGRTMTTKSWSFTTAAAADTVKPTVSSTTPAAAASGVNASTVVAVFDKAMTTTTMNGTTFYLKDNSSGLLVSGSVAYDVVTRTISFTPVTRLNVATNYTATIATTAKDLSGNTLAAPVIWSFTTTTTGSGSTVSNF